MAGGEPRLGTTATYMRHNDHGATHLSTKIDRLHERMDNEYEVFSAGSVKKWSKFGLAGAIMSLAAGLELTYFDVFERATKINRELAASFFYKKWSASTRRDIADAAVQRALDGNPMLREWSALYQ